MAKRSPYAAAVAHPSKDLGPLAFNADTSLPCNPGRSRSTRPRPRILLVSFRRSKARALATVRFSPPPFVVDSAVAPEDYSLFIDLFIRAGIWQSARTASNEYLSEK